MLKHSKFERANITADFVITHAALYINSQSLHENIDILQGRVNIEIHQLSRSGVGQYITTVYNCMVVERAVGFRTPQNEREDNCSVGNVNGRFVGNCRTSRWQ